MSFFSGLGNLFHGIANFFEGGDDNQDQKKKQQQPYFQSPAPINRGPAAPLSTQPQGGGNQPPAFNQPQKQDPFLSLFNPNGNQPLQKAQQQPPVAFNQPQPQPQPAQPPKPHASILHDITHNPVTNTVGDVAKSIGNAGSYLGKAAIIDPAVQTLADFSGDPYVKAAANEKFNEDLGLGPKGTDLGGGLKKWAGNSTTALLTVAAPGIDNLIKSGTEKAATTVLGDTGAENLIPAVTKYGSRFLTGGTLNTGLGAGQELQQGANPGEILKKAPEQFAMGGVLGEAVPVAASGLRKLTGRVLSAFRGEPNVPAPDEIATGVKSANPTRAQDAAQVHGDNLAKEQAAQPPQTTVEPSDLQKAATDINTPAYQRAPLKAAAADEAAAARTAQEEAVAPSQPTDTTPAYQHKQAIQDVIDAGDQELNNWLGENQGATQEEINTAKADIGQQVQQKIAALNEARYGTPSDLGAGPTSAPAEPIQQSPVVPQEAGSPSSVPTGPATRSTVPKVESTTPTTEQVVPQQPTLPVNPDNVSSEGNVAQTPNNVNGELKNARFQQAVTDAAKDPMFKEAFQSDPIEKDGAPLSELNQAAIDKVQQMSLPELVMQYGKDFNESSPVTTPASYYEHLQALRQLEQYPGDPTAAEAAANALRAVNDYAYRQGRGLAATRVAYDNLPASMKVAYIQKLVSKAGGELSAADLDRLTTAAELQTKFAKVAQDAEAEVNKLASKADKADPQFNAKMKSLLEGEAQAKADLYDQNREVVDVMTKNMPPSPLGDRIAQSARTMMLSSVGGRIFALTSTAFNAANYVADKTLSSVFGRAINAGNRALGRDVPQVRTSAPRLTTLFKGGARGAKGLVKEATGKGPIKDVEQAAMGRFYDSEYSHDATRYGKLGGITAPLRKAVRIGVGSHLALTKGIEDSELESFARQAAKERGIPNENVKGFVDFYKTHAPKNVAEEAKQVHLGVNNLHKNGWSDKVLGQIADGLDKIPVVGKQFRTTVIPFSKYMGGFIDKMLTDRNMFYNMYRIARARSPQELSDNLARLVTNVGTGVGLGYGLSKAGVITTKDQDGNSYDGLYFHIGNRYIPVEIAGQAAAPIIMGATFHQTNQKGGGGIQQWPQQVATNMLKASGVAGTFGSQTGPTQIFSDTGKGVPAVVGTAARQHIPGFFGDINSFLDYNDKLNPTHEKALTKATDLNPKTGRQNVNQVQTEINKTKATIPFVSQGLPRDTGKQAHDFLDRMLHSGQESGQQKTDAANAKAAADLSAQFKAQGIPDPTPGAYNGTKDTYANALQSVIERGEYDKAIASINQDIKQKQGDKNIPPSEIKKLQNKSTQFGVAKDVGLSYDDMKFYNDTSVSEWRKMGDPNSDTYNPDAYQKLWELDQKLAQKGVAGGFLIGDAKTVPSNKQKYSAKAPGTGSKGRSRGYSAASLIKDNTIGSAPDIKTISFGDLSPIKLDNFKIPTIQKIPASQLVKKRAITVQRGV